MKRILLLLAVAFIFGSVMPTMAQQKKTPVKRGTTTTKSGTTAKRTPTTTTINFTAQGELGIFALRGPVKECVWTTKNQTRKLGFDKKGMWISENGKEPWSNYGPVKRDNKGRMVLMGDGVETGEKFTYNSNGLLIKHITQYMDGQDVTTYTYNSKGECTKETFSYGDMYGSGKNTAVFTILSRDSQGNWTKRKTQKGFVETRTITYHENNMPSYLIKAPQLVSRMDSLSYFVGYIQSDGLLPYLKDKLQVDLNYLDDFILGLTGQEAIGNDNKRMKAYKAGEYISEQLTSQIITKINKDILGDVPETAINKDLFLAGYVSGTTGKNRLMTLDQAKTVVNYLIQAVKTEEAMKIYGSNKIAGEKFLASNAQKAGVKILPSGVQYRIIKEGTGSIPTKEQKVETHYIGYTIDGQEFDNSYKREKPAVFQIKQVILGWVDALIHMPVGSVWEVYIPQELAYGEREQQTIKPFSALIFRIELLRIVE